MSEGGMNGAPVTVKRKRGAHSGLIAIAVTVIILCAVVIFLNASFMKISSVKVVGNVICSAEYVAELSGVIGQGFLQVSENAVRDRIRVDRYLVFEGIERRFPNAVTITVRERIPCANLVVRGVLYVIDDECFTLERSDSLSLSNGLPTIIGLKTRLVRLGEHIVPSQEEQMAALSDLLGEIMAQNYISQVSDLDIADLNKLYLNTVDGFSVCLGGATELRAKLRTMRATIDKLRQEGYSGGSIEASRPGISTYTPPHL